MQKHFYTIVLAIISLHLNAQITTDEVEVKDLGTQSGNVGIGTTTPYYKLQLGDGIDKVWDNADQNADLFSSGGITLLNNKYLSLAHGWLVHANMRYYSGGGERKFQFQGYYGFRFFTRNDIEAISITGDNGYVGIGVNDPTSRLHINGNVNTGTMSFLNKEQENALDIGGSVYFDENYEADYAAMAGDGGGLAVKTQDGWGAVIATNNMQWIKPQFRGGKFTENVEFTKDANITGNIDITQNAQITGNVGIGRTPSYKLDVNGHSRLKTLILENMEQSTATDLGGSVYFDENYSGNYAAMETDGGGLAVKTQDGWGAVIATNNMQWIKPKFRGGEFTDDVIITGGKVGIGTASPSVPLQVAGTVKVSSLEATNEVKIGSSIIRRLSSNTSATGTSKDFTITAASAHVQAEVTISGMQANTKNEDVYWHGIITYDHNYNQIKAIKIASSKLDATALVSGGNIIFRVTDTSQFGYNRLRGTVIIH